MCRQITSNPIVDYPQRFLTPMANYFKVARAILQVTAVLVTQIADIKEEKKTKM